MPTLRKNERALRAVHPNAGIKDLYRRKIIALVDEMAKSYAYWLRAAYRKNEPVMAQDATPAAELQAAIDLMANRWLKKFNDGAPKLAKWFAISASKRSDAALRLILKEAGYTVPFRMTPAMRDILRATVNENVGLIKSIPQQFHTQVQGMVMRSVQTGRDLSTLTKDLQKTFGVTRRRAELIARDQNNKATSALMRARQTEMGINEGVWMHSHAGFEPRPTHLANDNKKFSVQEGWFDPDPKVRRRIWPGEMINCRCTWKPVVKGFT